MDYVPDYGNLILKVKELSEKQGSPVKLLDGFAELIKTELHFEEVIPKPYNEKARTASEDMVYNTMRYYVDNRLSDYSSFPDINSFSQTECPCCGMEILSADGYSGFCQFCEYYTNTNYVQNVPGTVQKGDFTAALKKADLPAASRILDIIAAESLLLYGFHRRYTTPFSMTSSKWSSVFISSANPSSNFTGEPCFSLNSLTFRIRLP